MEMYLLPGGGDPYLFTSEIYHPSTAEFSQDGNLVTPRAFGHTATLLQNGTVLITGGINISYHTTAAAEIYDPITHGFSSVGSMHYQRANHTATLLPSGMVLIAGGTMDGLGGVQPAELYDPATQTFSLTGNLLFRRMYHRASLLPSGKVLLTGGVRTSSNEPDVSTNVEIYDPDTGQFNFEGNLSKDIYLHTATTLANGNVLIIGGLSDSSGYSSSIEEFNPDTGITHVIGNSIIPRMNHTATTLLDGRILIAGGEHDGEALNSAEIYDPSTEKVLSTGSMLYTRSQHTATLLSDGRVLVAGGGTNTAEIFNPQGNENSLPTINEITVSPNPVQVNIQSSSIAIFSDNDLGDSHTALWDWGDGTTSVGTVNETNGSGYATGMHSYSSTGTFIIKVTITDSNGGAQDREYSYISVYDPTPEALFAGARLFSSPIGADPENPNIAGQVKFGITAKYLQSAPTGNVTLNFSADNLTFASNDINILVINGSSAFVRGTGTVNGSGGYTFLASGIDGHDMGTQDYVRFQIKSPSGSIIYDTQPGNFDYSSPNLQLQGQIIVH